MRLITREESLKLDQELTQRLSSEEPDHWMELAGKRMAEVLLRIVESSNQASEVFFLFLCGEGNNGGDGCIIARELWDRGYRQMEMVSGNETKGSKEKNGDQGGKGTQGDEIGKGFNSNNSSAATSLSQLKKAELEKRGLSFSSPEDWDFSQWKKKKYLVVVDAVFGVGLSRSVEDPWKKIFLDLNRRKSSSNFKSIIVAVDVPSGLHSSTGISLGVSLKADWTLCVAPLKAGLFLNEGPTQAGKIEKIDLHFPQALVSSCAQSVRLVGKKTFEALRPKRIWSSNKTHFGDVVILGGSRGFEGAALLAGSAAYRSGCGYVTLISESENLKNRASGDFLLKSVDDLEEALFQKKKTAVVWGPGWKEKSSTFTFKERIFSILKRAGVPVVIDAGAFSWVARQKAPENWVYTPHAGELSRVLGVSAHELEKDRLLAARRASEKIKGVVVFKGFHTLVQLKEKSFVIASGNPSLSKAGTGDVLSGLIGSFLAQGLSSEKAAAAASYLHGAVADRWIQEGNSIHSLMASDLVNELKREI